jgi:branched-chain amino acid transport system ATP-binding protein
MTATILEAKDVTKRFGGFVALSGVNFSLLQGERVGLIGPNGSGKSTFVNCLSGIFTPEAGSVTFAGKDITNTPAWQRAKHGLARTYQIPRPFKGMTVLENIAVPLRFVVGYTSARAIGEAAREILDQVGLGEKAEVMAGLSESEVDEILDLLNRLNGEGISILLIEHIMRAVMMFSQRIVVIVAGCKIADGLPDEVMRQDEVERAYLGE